MQVRTRPAGVSALALFFLLGAAISAFAAVLLLYPGSVLDAAWRLNPRAREGFAGMGWWAVLLMAVVCLACLASAHGLWQRLRWGYWLALAVLSINVAGDALNAFLADDWRTLIGLPIAGAMIAYLIKQRRAFAG